MLDGNRPQDATLDEGILWNVDLSLIAIHLFKENVREKKQQQTLH
jgi:hypothetical protein